MGTGAGTRPAPGCDFIVWTFGERPWVAEARP
jgi:hypothetical protein